MICDYCFAPVAIFPLSNHSESNGRRWECLRNPSHCGEWTVSKKDNPLLVQRKQQTTESEIDPLWGLHRVAMQKTMAWAIPNEEALDEVAKSGPVFDPMAGTGYWVHLLRQRGVDAIATDLNLPTLRESPPQRVLDINESLESWINKTSPSQGQTQCAQWTTVVEMDVLYAVRLFAHRTMLLCWPPYAATFDTDSGGDGIAKYREAGGQRLVYVGEPPGEGCCGGPLMEQELSDHWEIVHSVDLPHWENMQDALFTYERKEKS